MSDEDHFKTRISANPMLIDANNISDHRVRLAKISVKEKEEAREHSSFCLRARDKF